MKTIITGTNVPYRIESFNRLYKVIDDLTIQKLLKKNIVSYA